MNKDILIHRILRYSGVEVSLSWKTVYLGKTGLMEEKVKVKALHVEINAIFHTHNFTTL